MLNVLFERGWSWMPGFETVRSLRRTLLNFDVTNLISLLELMRQHRQASRCILHELLRTPTMQGRLNAHRFYPDLYLETITW